MTKGSVVFVCQLFSRNLQSSVRYFVWNPCVSSICRLCSDAATTIDTMLTNLNTPTFLAEATSVASDLPCWHSFDPKRRPGYVLALAGRCAR